MQKSWLIVKEGNIDAARSHFENTNINITTEGRKYLGAALGTKEFCDTFLKNKVENWTKEIERLSVIAKTQPHAAYSAFTHGVSSRWTNMARTNSNLAQFLQLLTKAIDSDLIPAVTDQSAHGETMRKVFALPTRRGGLGIIDHLSLHREFAYSLKVTEPLTKLILQQQNQMTEEVSQQQSVLKASVECLKNLVINVTDEEISANFNRNLKRAVDLAKEKVASVWLTALPIYRRV